jgi:uncharacterized protein YndB with AHSA1/START domain
MSMPGDRFFLRDGRPTVRVERAYPHPIEKVWRAVTTPQHLGAWFPSPVEVDLRPGGEMRFPAFEGDTDATGTVEAVEAPRLLTFTWGADRLTFELAPDGEGTTFALIHSFDDRYGAASFATGWELCLAGLRSVLAGEPVPPPDRGIARHEELVHEFGLDRPEVTESGGRWTVRVERQLMCPAEVAWNLWFGKDRDTGEQRTAPAVGEALTPYMAPDVVVGTMTDVELHRVLAFDVATAGGSRSPSPAPSPPSATRPPRCGAPVRSGTSPPRPRSGRWRSRSTPDVIQPLGRSSDGAMLTILADTFWQETRLSSRWSEASGWRPTAATHPASSGSSTPRGDAHVLPGPGEQGRKPR